MDRWILPCHLLYSFLVRISENGVDDRYFISIQIQQLEIVDFFLPHILPAVTHEYHSSDDLGKKLIASGLGYHAEIVRQLLEPAIFITDHAQAPSIRCLPQHNVLQRRPLCLAVQ